jgi:hypothetical protein
LQFSLQAASPDTFGYTLVFINVATAAKDTRKCTDDNIKKTVRTDVTIVWMKETIMVELGQLRIYGMKNKKSWTAEKRGFPT